MFRLSAVLLAVLLIFGLVFSLLPSGGDVARSGVTLRGVQLSLYPEQDPDAVWRFRATALRVDPLKSENTLDGLGQGERWLKKPDGSETLNLTLKADHLVIDADSNLRAEQAQIYILDGCVTLNMRSAAGKPVFINQRSGYSAPDVQVSSPSLNLGFDDFSSSFDFKNARGDQRPGASAQIHPSSVCKAGKIVPRAPSSQP
ncbi:hypothetical protein [Deinococcus sp.]|uniref:hypothetical protein n=1 Tax=Deinococcus sp. TaxID=47478 RepID=UPI003CC579DB